MRCQSSISRAFASFILEQGVRQNEKLSFFLVHAHFDLYQKREVGVEELMPLPYFLITHAISVCQRPQLQVAPPPKGEMQTIRFEDVFDHGSIDFRLQETDCCRCLR